jgi:hypothetical protein
VHDTSAGQPFPPPPRRHQKTNAPRVDARTPLYRLAGVALSTSAGIEENTALLIRSKGGPDMPQWPSVTHVWSWLGLGPQPQLSGGTVLSRRVRPGAPRVTGARRLAARTLHHSQNAWGACLRRRKGRLGPPKAIPATAHQLARLVSSRVRPGSASVQQGLDAYAAQSRARQGTTLAKQAKALGYTRVSLASPG